MFDDLKTAKITVPDLYNATDRTAYANGLPDDCLPNESKRLKVPVPLDELEPAQKGKKKATAPKKKSPPKRTPLSGFRQMSWPR